MTDILWLCLYGALGVIKSLETESRTVLLLAGGTSGAYQAV